MDEAAAIMAICGTHYNAGGRRVIPLFRARFRDKVTHGPLCREKP